MKKEIVLSSTLVFMSLSIIAPINYAAPIKWVSTWTASPQQVWGTDFLFPTNAPKELHHQTVNQVAQISLGGEKVRIVLANDYGKEAIKIGQASIYQGKTLKEVTFNGKKIANIAPGHSLISDPVELTVPDLSSIYVNLYFPDKTPITTFHWDARQTGKIILGNHTSNILNGESLNSQNTSTRLFLSAIQVQPAKDAQLIAVIGDSITDGATASMDKNTRWTDFLSRRLVKNHVSVINAGISGGRLLSDGMGVSGLKRLERDVLKQPGIKSVILALGINDIAWPATVFAPQEKSMDYITLTTGYQQFISMAHNHGVKVIGTTITPFENALPNSPIQNYYTKEKNELRLKINQWILTSGAFDDVIDLDGILKDPDHPNKMLSQYDSGDHLHPGDTGNQAIADAIDLNSLISK